VEKTESHSQLAEAGTLTLGRGLSLFVPLICAGNLVGVFLRYPNHGAAILFPPYAVLTAVLLASRRRDWIVYIVVGTVCHFATSIQQWPFWWVALADVANVARACVAVLLLERLLGTHPRLDSIASLVRFVVAAAIVAPAVGATIGATNAILYDTPTTYAAMWRNWFGASALTALTLLPPLMEVAHSPATWRLARFGKHRSIEGVLFAAALTVSGVVVYVSLMNRRYDGDMALYASLPVLLWAGLRFGPAGTGFTAAVLTAAAVLGIDHRAAGHPTTSSVLRLQLFVFLTAVPVLCVAVVANALQDAVQLYRALLASLQDQVAILDAEGTVIRVNDSWQRQADMPSPCPFERARAGDNFLLCCQHASEILATLHPEDRDPSPRRLFNGTAAVLLGEYQRYETDYELKHDGQREWFTIRVESLERADGGAVVTRANISVRRQAQAEVEEQRRQLAHLGRVAVLGQLSGALAHELRQPLAAILANAEAARHLVEHEPIDVAEISAIHTDVVAEARRAAAVIDGLRAMHRRGDMRLEAIAPEDLVRETLRLAHTEIITRGVSANWVVDSELPAVLADRVQIQQVLLNLILNACEAMGDRDAADRLLTLGASESGAHVRFSVRDAGTGIPDALIESLFEPFVTTKPEGLGLGLSIARTVVDTHGGRIWAENGADHGATINFLLPSAPLSEEPVRLPDHSYDIHSGEFKVLA
jgi:signal transduction histidine kinase/integral membrane sensor domain MASE1